MAYFIRSDEMDSRDELEALLKDRRGQVIVVESGEPHKRFWAYGRAWAVYVRDPDSLRGTRDPLITGDGLGSERR